MTRARKTLEEQILALEARKKTLQARLTKQERARDTRRKILLGALLLERIDSKRDPEFAKRLTDWLKLELPGFLTRDGDRILFEDILGSIPTSNKQSR